MKTNWVKVVQLFSKYINIAFGFKKYGILIL